MQIKFDHFPDILVFYLKRFNQVVKPDLIMGTDLGTLIWIFTADIRWLKLSVSTSVSITKSDKII